MAPLPLTAPNTMGMTGTETPVQRQPEGEYGPTESKGASPVIPVMIIFALATVAVAGIDGRLHVYLKLYIVGLGEGRVVVAYLCYAGYWFAIFIFWIICIFIASKLMLFCGWL